MLASEQCDPTSGVSGGETAPPGRRPSRGEGRWLTSWRAVFRPLQRGGPLRDTLHLSSSTLVYQVLYLLRGIVAARILGPELMGVWAAGYILNLYLTNSHLGTLSAMRREMTIARGQADSLRVDELRAAGFTMATIPALLAALAVALWTGWFWGQLSPTYRWVLLLVTGLSLLQQVSLFYSFCLFSQERFGQASRSNVVIALLLVLTAPLIWWGGLAGFALGFVFSQIAGLAILIRAAEVPLRLSFNWKVLTYLIREGLPFLGSNVVYTVQTSIDRIIVLDFYGERFLGLYSLVLQGLSLANILVGSISQVSYTRMGVMFGEVNDPAKLHAQYQRLPALIAWAVMPLLLLGTLAAEPFVRLVLPNYLEAVPAARLACVQAFVMALTIVPSGYLSTIRRNGVHVAIQLVATGLTWVCCVVSALAGSGLEGITLANATATAVYALLLYAGAAYFGQQRLRRLVSVLLTLVLPLVFGGTLAVSVLWAAAHPNPLSLLFALTSAVGVAVCYVILARRSGILAFLKRT
jgi:O-antigen/teichoic acid export membrane protein